MTRWVAALALLPLCSGLLSCGAGAPRGESAADTVAEEGPGSPRHRYRHVASWGVAGSGPGELTGSQGLAVGPDGDLYLTDPANHRIHRLRPVVDEPSTGPSDPP